MISQKQILIWLSATAFMVFCMAVIGAVTRLTESGLSMVEWRPLIGAIPPLNEAEWTRVFEKYKKTSEFTLQNYWMGLSDFKQIFFWEWFHRLWGRLIGLVYALPLAYFWIRGMLPARQKPAFLVILALGMGQAVMGWWMVKSGFVDRTDVSHYRLAMHLGLAFIIFGALVWQIQTLRRGASAFFGRCPKSCPKSCPTDRQAMTMARPARSPRRRREGPRDKISFCFKRHAVITLGLLAITIIWGAFVAGQNGGLVYNTWPLMDGKLVPEEISSVILSDHAVADRQSGESKDPLVQEDGGPSTPDLRSSAQNDSFSVLWTTPAGAQFFHRWIAIFTLFMLLTFAQRTRSLSLCIMSILQVGLGIATLLTQVWIPLAAAHQAGAFILLAILLLKAHDGAGYWKADG